MEDLCNGPGKVGQALGIDMAEMNGMSLVNDERLKIVDGGIEDFTVGVSRRINIDYAEEWIDKPWRFYIEGNNYVSKVPVSKKSKSKSKNK
jgi:DNA-3-methyladenine glycosylase